MAPAKKKVDDTDGRRQRSEVSRERIVQALLELIEAGNVAPLAEDVAKQAGVGLRTVFRHFDNMESLYRQIDAAITAEVLPIVEVPIASGPWRMQIKDMIGRRIRVFERIMPFKTAADVHRHISPFLDAQMTMFARAERGMLTAILPDDVRKDAELVEGLDLLLSFETWRRLRRDQKLSLTKARRALDRLVTALVGER